MRITKKGFEAGFLVAIIITVVAGVLVGATVMKFAANMNDKEAEILCHDSIALRARSALNINENADDKLISAQIKAVPVLCKTVDLKVKGDREKILETISQKIARCWWMFGEGRYDNIGGKSSFKVVPVLLGTNRQPNQCFNCYNLMVAQDEISKGGTITSGELMNYMWTHNPPGYNGTNYLQYIQSFGGPGMFVNVVLEGIQPGKAYSISILPVNIEEGKTNWVTVGGFIALGVGAVLAVGCEVVSVGACTPLVVAVAGGLITGGSYTAAGGLTKDIVTRKYSPANNPETPLAPGNQDIQSKISIDTMFKERKYSSVYLSDATYGNKFCGSGDLAGK